MVNKAIWHKTLLSIPLEKSGWSLDLLIWKYQHYNRDNKPYTKIELYWNIRGKVNPEDKEKVTTYCSNEMAQSIIDYIIGERRRANGPYR